MSAHNHFVLCSEKINSKICSALTGKDRMGSIKTKIMFLLICFALMANALSSSNSGLGVKSGDWVDYGFQETFSSGGEQWQTIEFLSVNGTIVTVRVTIHMSAGIENSQTETIDLSSSDDFQTIFFSLRVHIIFSDSEVGDSVYLGEFGNQTIVGETIGTVAGADRKLVYSNFSLGGSLYTFYWDKETGVLAEGITVLGVVSKTVWIKETNMWLGEFVWWPWVIVIIAVVCIVVALRKNISQKLRRKANKENGELGIILNT